MVNLKDYWDNSHKDYKNLVDSSNFVKETEKLLKPNSKILDIGGANGSDSIYLYNKGHRPTIIDISSVAKELLEAKNTNIPYIVQSISDTPYPLESDSFDYVYSRLTIQYFNSADTIEIYKEIYRLLKPNGIAYIIFKSLKDQRELLKLKEDGKEIEPNVYESEDIIKSRFSIDQIKEQLINAGIESYKITEEQEPLVGSNKYGHTELLVNKVVIYKS